MYSVKVKSENKDDLTRFLEEIKKRLGVPLAKIESFLEKPETFGKALIASEISVYYLVLWILDHGSDGDGYGFPFDHRHLNFYNRLKTAYSILKKITPLYSFENRNKKIIWKLYHLIKDIAENIALEKKVEQYKTKLAVFSELHDALGTVPENVKNGLCRMNETGTFKELKAIKNAVAKFKNKLKRQAKNTDDKKLCSSFEKIIKRLEEYDKSLFSDPFAVKVNGKKRIIFILRTNNILENHFRRFNYWCRRIHGNHSVRRNIENIPEQFPIVENLNNPNYMELIFGDETKIVQKFSGVDVEKIREMSNTIKRKQKIYSSNKIKKVIRKLEFEKYLINSFASAAS